MGTAFVAPRSDGFSVLARTLQETTAGNNGNSFEGTTASAAGAALLEVSKCLSVRSGGPIQPNESTMRPHEQDAAVTARLGHMFVAVWSRSLAPPFMAPAYELLAKLCAQRFLEFRPGNAGALNGDGGENGPQWLSLYACVSILTAAILSRNEQSLSTADWGKYDLGIKDGGLAECSAEALRIELAGHARQFGAGVRCIDELAAVLRLL